MGVQLRANMHIDDTLNKTDSDISNEALDFIKKNKSKLFETFLVFKNADKKAFFMAGSPGAGKTEFSKALSVQTSIDRLDADEIREMCPKYSGANSKLFQRASSKGISYLMDKIFKDETSFILDGNFDELKIQSQNMDRAVKRDYEIEILFIYRSLSVAKQYTEIREKKEGRNIPDDVFYGKFLDAINTVNVIAKEKGLTFSFYDLEKQEYLESLSNFDEVIFKYPNVQDDIDLANSKTGIENTISKKVGLSKDGL